MLCICVNWTQGSTQHLNRGAVVYSQNTRVKLRNDVRDGVRRDTDLPREMWGHGERSQSR